MKKTLYNLRMKIANTIKPKRKFIQPIGKIGKASMVEGSSRIDFNLFNNKVKVSLNLKDILKVCK
jgi:hypothetical protein